MKLHLLIVIVMLTYLPTTAQFSNFSAELNYPIPVGDNFVGENYFGIVDLGLDYRFLDAGPLKIGLAMNGGILKVSSIDDIGGDDPTVISYVLRPKIFGELNLESISKLRPSAGIGYSFLIFDVSEFGGERVTPSEDETQSGFNINLGLSYYFTKRFFAQLQYDFIILDLDDEIPDSSYNKNVSIIYVGLGITI